MLGSQAATRANHWAVGLRVLQGMGVGMVQRRLLLWVPQLGFELLLIHTRRPIMGKRLREERQNRMRFFDVGRLPW